MSADWFETIRTILWAGLLRCRRGDVHGLTKQNQLDQAVFALYDKTWDNRAACHDSA